MEKRAAHPYLICEAVSNTEDSPPCLETAHMGGHERSQAALVSLQK